MVLRYTLVYITDILPMFIRNIVIVKLEIFLEELLVLKREIFCSFPFYVISHWAYS